MRATVVIVGLVGLVGLVGCGGARGTDVGPRAHPHVTINNGKIVTITAVTFETDSDVLRDASRPLLDEVAEAIKSLGSVKRVRIEGHTDERGDDEYNLDLSRRRAQAVKDYLVKRGLDATRLSTQGFGRNRPTGDNSSDEGRASNRRVEFILVE